MTAEKEMDWAFRFYQELGYRITEDEEDNNALQLTMEKIFKEHDKLLCSRLKEEIKEVFKESPNVYFRDKCLDKIDYVYGDVK